MSPKTPRQWPSDDISAKPILKLNSARLAPEFKNWKRASMQFVYSRLLWQVRAELNLLVCFNNVTPSAASAAETSIPNARRLLLVQHTQSRSFLFRFGSTLRHHSAHCGYCNSHCNHGGALNLRGLKLLINQLPHKSASNPLLIV